jgi:hypothetical protein
LVFDGSERSRQSDFWLDQHTEFPVHATRVQPSGDVGLTRSWLRQGRQPHPARQQGWDTCRFSSSRFKRVVDPKVIKAIGFTLEAFPPRSDDPIE